jgi:hypothetical protein
LSAIHTGLVSGSILRSGICPPLCEFCDRVIGAMIPLLSPPTSPDIVELACKCIFMFLRHFPKTAMTWKRSHVRALLRTFRHCGRITVVTYSIQILDLLLIIDLGEISCMIGLSSFLIHFLDLGVSDQIICMNVITRLITSF